jgi:hypothetical protein
VNHSFKAAAFTPTLSVSLALKHYSYQGHFVLAFFQCPRSSIWLINNSYKLGSHFISISVFLRSYGYHASPKPIVNNSLCNCITLKPASPAWRSLKQQSKQCWGHRTPLLIAGSLQTQPAALLPQRPVHKQVQKPSCFVHATGSAANSYN